MENSKFHAALANMFFNARGEFCTNGKTSRSKIAKERRRKAKIEALEAQRDTLAKRLRREGCRPCILKRLAEIQAEIAAC
jgi:hypothetical protein